jgi:hypothetical protein
MSQENNKESKELLVACIAEAPKHDGLHSALPTPSQHINKAWLFAYQQSPTNPMVIGAFRHNWDVNPPENPKELDAFLLRYLIGLRLYKEKVHKIETTEENLIKRITEYMTGAFAKLPYPGFHDMSQDKATAGSEVFLEVRLPIQSMTGHATVTRSREVAFSIRSDALRFVSYPATEKGFQDYLSDLKRDIIDGHEIVTGNLTVTTHTLGAPNDDATVCRLIAQRVDQILTARQTDLRNRFMNHASRGRT